MAAAGILVVAIFGPLRDGVAIDLRNGRSFIQDNLWSADGYQYAVWVGEDSRPLVGQRRRGEDRWSVTRLDSVPGNPLRAPTRRDPHHVYSLGVDAAGHVFVAGNMHASDLRMIRSARPHDITAWAPVELGGSEWEITYPTFARLPGGGLMFYRRVGRAGLAHVELDVLRPGASSWTHVGPVVTGRPSGEGPYLHRVATDDRTLTVHLLVTWRRASAPDTTNDVSYLRSRDGGRRWETSTGAELSLPVTHDRAEMVLDTEPTGSGLVNGGGLAVDAAGRPHGVLRFDRNTRRRHVHVWHDGERWHRSDIEADLNGRPAIVAGPDGRVWLFGVRRRDLRLVPLGRPTSSGETIAAVPRGWEATFDEGALRLRGELQTLVPDGGEPVVHGVPLPGR